MFSKIFYFLCFLLLFIVIQISTLAENFWPNESANDFSTMNHLLLLLISSVIAFGLAFLLYHKVNNDVILGKAIIFKNVGFSILMAILSQGIQSLISIWTDDKASNADLASVLHTSLSPILIVTLIFVSPVLEEFLFQGVLQGGILKEMHPFVQILLTSVIFAFFHGYSFSLDTLELLFSGIAYASVYHVTNDLKMAILCHSLSNLIVTILVLVYCEQY